MPGAVLAVFGVLLTIPLAGCEDEPDSSSSLEYVALGDSFTAAPWLRTQSTDGCARSDRNYPHLVAAELEEATLVDVSCGGATTEDILESQDRGSRVHPPQVDSLSEQTDLVTIGIGGNDLGIAFQVIQGCVQARETAPSAAPCREALGGRMGRAVREAGANVAEVLEAIQRRAPDALVMLVGYPRFLPDSGGCPDRLPLADGDVAFVRQVLADLDEVLRSAADSAGVTYVDVYSASRGHDICSPEPWVNGDQSDPETRAAPYHPTPAHQRAVARMVLEAR